MKITTLNRHKSIPRGIEFEIPDFCIFTGKNGSGKSHLLEAIANRGISHVYKNEHAISNIQLVGFNGLNPQVDEQCDSNHLSMSINNWWGQIQSVVLHYRQEIQQGQFYNDIHKDYLLPHHGHNPVLVSTIGRLVEKSGKRLNELTQNDVSMYLSFTSMTQNQNQIFFSQCALIFKAYHDRLYKNDVAEFRANKYVDSSILYLTPQQFFETYGPPPWDLVNDILSQAKLPYQFLSPEQSDSNVPYRLRLIDKTNDFDISVNDLSSGEKVLMSLALAIYNSNEGGAKPDLLLLDEPDAPLHPQFSKLLIDIIVETIVKKAGVSVIITTHSPSTVAMAPPGTGYEIVRETKIPRLVSNSDAVAVLTEGIDFLRVSYDERKLVFVESKYDVEYFDRLHKLLCRRHNFSFTPTFLAPHSGTSNCTDVVSIVGNLRRSGVELVVGVVDFDLKNESSDQILVLGGGARYSIENYLLDPLYVCLALIRSEKKKFSDFGVFDKHVYTNTSNLTELDCQNIVDNFFGYIGIPIENLLPISLINGFKLNYPESFLIHQGHQYEALILEKIKELGAISKGKGEAGLKLGVMTIIEEFPEFLPTELIDTFVRMIGISS